MARLFEEHHLRHCVSLDGAWKFSTDPADWGKNNTWYLGLPSGHTVNVPSVWNTERGLLDYEGVAWYEKTFFTSGGCLRFCFGAVMTEAEVWLDGVRLGAHYGGFTQFSFIVPDVAEGSHRLDFKLSVFIYFYILHRKKSVKLSFFFSPITYIYHAVGRFYSGRFKFAVVPDNNGFIFCMSRIAQKEFYVKCFRLSRLTFMSGKGMPPPVISFFGERSFKHVKVTCFVTFVHTLLHLIGMLIGTEKLFS